jgi:hypothetical protein
MKAEWKNPVMTKIISVAHAQGVGGPGGLDDWREGCSSVFDPL